MAFRGLAASRPAVRESGPRAAPVASQPATDDEIGRMAEQLGKLEAALESERAARQEACEAALAAGREEGRAQAESDASDRLAALRAGIAQAVADLPVRLDARGDLAVAIARAALSKILGDQASYRPMIEDIVRHQLAQAATGTIVQVRVSANDFEDQAAVASLAADNGVAIVREATLPAGSCLFDLTLGTIDASIPLQASAIDAVLATHGGLE